MSTIVQQLQPQEVGMSYTNSMYIYTYKSPQFLNDSFIIWNMGLAQQSSWISVNISQFPHLFTDSWEKRGTNSGDKDSYACVHHWKVYTDVLNWRNSLQSFTEIQQPPDFPHSFSTKWLDPIKKKQLKNKHCDSLRPTTPDILQESDWSTSPTYRAFHTAIQDGLTNSFANTTFRSTITCNKHPSATFNPSSLLISLIPSHISFSCCSGHPCWRWLCADVADMTHISSLSMSKSPISPIILTISNL